MKPFPRLAQFRITREVAAGPVSTVFEGETRSGKLCVLKVFATAAGHGTEIIADASRFYFREVDVLCNIQHPNIVSLMDFGQTLDTEDKFIALEHIQGRDFLTASLEASREHFYSMVAQICRALTFLHSRGFVHGDLKPDNFIVTLPRQNADPSPSVTLIDFGYSKAQDIQSIPILEGSPHYLAPETLEGKNPTPLSDLYSLGVILYHCLAGVPPFSGDDVGTILKQHLLQTPAPIPRGPLEALHPLIYQLMSKEPARRPQSAAEVLRQMNATAPNLHFQLHTTDSWHANTQSVNAIGTAVAGDRSRRFLASALTEDRAHSPRIILITGGRGVGKSRFLREMKLFAHSMGFNVHTLEGVRRPDPGGLFTFPQSHGSPAAQQSLLACDDVHSDIIGPLQSFLDAIPPGDCTPVVLLSFSVSNDIGGFLGSAIARLTTPDRLLAISLASLGDAELALFLRESAKAKDVHPEVVTFVSRQTGGNHALVTRFVAEALDHKLLMVDKGILVASGPYAKDFVSPALSQYVRDCYESLSAIEERVLLFVAASGSHLSTHDIASLTSLPEAVAASICDALYTRGLFARHTDNGTAYSASCELLSHVLLASLPFDTKRRVHTQLAEWYIANASDDSHMERAALNFVAAGAPSKALRCSFLAAMRAEARHDNETAMRFYAHALELSPANLRVRARATVGVARACQRLGRARECLDLLAQIGGSVGLPLHMAFDIAINRSYAAELAGDFYLMESESRTACTLAAHPPLTRYASVAIAQLGSALCRLERRHEGIPLLFRTVAKCGKGRDRAIKARALNELAACSWKIGEYRRSITYLRRSLKLHGDQIRRRVFPLEMSRIGVLQADLGAYSRARRTHRSALQMAQQQGARVYQAAALNNIGETYRVQGRWKSALAVYREAAQAVSGSGACIIALTVDYNIAYLMARSGHYARTLHFLRGRIDLSQRLGSAQCTNGLLLGWGTLLLATGRAAMAYRLSIHACTLAVGTDLHSSILELRVLYAHALLAIGQAERAHGEVRKALNDYERRSPFDVLLSAHLTEMQIDRALGLSPEAFDERLKPILEKARKKKMAWHTTWALILRGEALLEAGRSEEAEKDLTEATKIAQKNADRPQFWKASYWLGRVFEQRLQYERALGSYRVAALTVNELAMDIDDDRYREPFLAQPEVREVQARFERLRGEVGKKARHDIAAMSRSEKISRRMLNALNAIGQKLTSILDLDDLLTNLLDLSIENVRAERGLVFLRDEATGEMRLACARNMDKESLDEVSSFSRSVIKRVTEGHTILEVDVGNDPALSAFQSLVIHEIKSILCVPMRTRGNTVGVIYLDTRRAAQMFTDKERTFIESFASQAAIAIENARVFGDISAENARLKREAAGKGRFENLIGTSAAMMKLSDTIAGVMGSDCNVLVAGESGTGKELVAKAIHYNGPRQKKKFVAIDCGALPESLLEAELFGFVRGAFTGADRDKVGLLEESHGGTLFLDEITNTSVGLQARLLRVLQEHEVRRLGENTPRRVDARIIAATNADIAALIRDGKFRSDLYYRLNVVTIEVPPLRDRREDVPLLVDHFVRQRSPDEASRKRLAPGVIEALGRYDWPGNVRELENVVERLLVLARGPVIMQEALPENIRAAAGLRDVTAVARNAADDGGNNGQNGGGNGHKTGEQMMVEDSLRRFGGDKAKAARFIGWNRQKLYRKMKGFGIPADYGRTV